MLGPYSVSKTALLGLTKVMSAEVANDGIRVNCIAPGIIKTKFSQAVSDIYVTFCYAKVPRIGPGG